jgi:hypothetical protein
LTQIPLLHLTGVAKGHLAIEQLSIFGSVHIPFAHFCGNSFGQPLANGHVLLLEAQEPSGHKTAPLAHE